MAKIKIDKSLYERVEKTAERAGHSSADGFVTHLRAQAVPDAPGAPTAAEAETARAGRGYIE